MNSYHKHNIACWNRAQRAKEQEISRHLWLKRLKKCNEILHDDKASYDDKLKVLEYLIIEEDYPVYYHLDGDKIRVTKENYKEFLKDD